MITRIFWILFAVEGSVSLGAALYFLSPKGSRGWGPEGPVGGWLLLFPPVLLAGLLAFVLFTRSDATKLMGIVLMGLPLVPIAAGPFFSAWDNHQTQRSMEGDDDFTQPAQRNLAHAIRAHDAALVRSLIPGAGNLNTVYNGETLLRFAVYNTGKAPGALEVVQSLLDAGADPNFAAGSSYPLEGAMYAGPAYTEALLKAGADPNRLDDAGRPLWWQALSSDTDENLASLRILLDHGANLSLRDSQGGPVAWAAYHAWMSHASGWRMVWLLMERGAAWKDEQSWGKSVVDMFLDDVRLRGTSTQPPYTDEMRKIQALIASERGRQ